MCNDEIHLTQDAFTLGSFREPLFDAGRMQDVDLRYGNCWLRPHVIDRWCVYACDDLTVCPCYDQPRKG